MEGSSCSRSACSLPRSLFSKKLALYHQHTADSWIWTYTSDPAVFDSWIWSFTWAFRLTFEIFIWKLPIHMTKLTFDAFQLPCNLSKIKCATPNMNAVCRQVLHCYRISSATLTHECSMPYCGIDCTLTEMCADCRYLAGKGCREIRYYCVPLFSVPQSCQILYFWPYTQLLR